MKEYKVICVQETLSPFGIKRFESFLNDGWEIERAKSFQEE